MTQQVKQLRLVIETDDFDAALRFFRDAMGLAERESYSGDGGAEVAILDLPSATLEIANREQVAMIDRVEVGRSVSRASTFSMRVALEVDDAHQATGKMVEAGAELVAPPTRTPWNSLNSRLEAPGGIQVRAFEELGGDA